MKQRTHETFLDGLRDSIPIAIIYFIVSFTFGVTVAEYAFPAWYAALFSAVNYTSIGEITGLNMIVEGATLLEIGLAVFIVNLRYILTGLSLSQKLDTKSKWKRALIGIFITDEVYAVVAHYNKITFKYYMGISPLPYVMWTLGTFVGALTDAILPEVLQASMGIALYCMFIGLIVPPAMRDKRIFFTIGLSAGLSCLFYFVPYLNRVSFGVRIVIAAVIAAAVSALVFPITQIDDDSVYTREACDLGKADSQDAQAVTSDKQAKGFEEASV